MSKHNVGNVRKHRTADYDHVLRKIHDEICTDYAINKDELFRRGRKSTRAKARSVFCYKAHKEELLPLSVINKYLNISITAVANLVRRGEDGAKKGDVM